MSSRAYFDGVTAPQLSVRSKKARDLARELSRREGRPIHAIVEEALVEYARRHPRESAEAFLRRMRAMAVEDVDLEELIGDHRVPHPGIDL